MGVHAPDRLRATSPATIDWASLLPPDEVTGWLSRIRASETAMAAVALVAVAAPARADTTVFPIQFGNPGDKPIVGNWPDWHDGDDPADEVGVYRPSTQTFFRD